MMDLTTSPQINGYKLLSKIGAGKHAHVYLAVNSSSEKHYAVRIVEKKGSKIVFDFRRFTRALEKLVHVNVVEMVEYFESDEYLVIVMELLDDMVTLEEFLESGALMRPRDKMFVFKQCLDAVVYMRREGIAHRDIKLENIMIDPVSFKVKIVDFGYACRSDIICSDAVGTPYFMAPEVLAGGRYDPKLSDIWSLGVVLYTIIFYEIPFSADDMDELKAKVMSPYTVPRFVNKLRQVHPAIRFLICSMLSANPQERKTPEELLLFVHSLGIDNETQAPHSVKEYV
eukprot:TRINITY_DN7411_c0_g1_i1.p1 TRINITY_DN7411_c0_g1~~TRINITY_DN7411_c0_g1_i1.p1  ORF type:complete len:314 (-),score=59.94 TRINITY_DN7411_c0_g1_i1:79-933(-)